MGKIINLIKNNRSFILYAVFGVLTTVINIFIYQILYAFCNVSNVASNIVAWVFAVSFAYITNRKYVFDSKTTSKKEILSEFTSFIVCRLATGGLDIAIMFVAVDLLSLNSLLMKIISNVLVIIINYVASKLIIFKK